MKRFTRVNEPFTCCNCQREVPPAKKTCRNHCPFCLHSLHVDVNPGDRASDCKGVLKPVGYETAPKNQIDILFRCTRCGFEGRNRAVISGDDPVPDDYDAILKLSLV